MPRISKKELEAQIEAICKKRLSISKQESKLRQQVEALKKQYLKSVKCPVCGATIKDTTLMLEFDFMFLTYDFHCSNCGLNVEGKTMEELRNNLRKQAREVKKCQDSDHQ